jgi:hypothetical protein
MLVLLVLVAIVTVFFVLVAVFLDRLDDGRAAASGVPTALAAPQRPLVELLLFLCGVNGHTRTGRGRYTTKRSKRIVIVIKSVTDC